MADQYFANVVLLACQNNGADGSTAFIDQSPSAHTLTAAGNAQWDTAQAPTGLTSSLLCDGTGDWVSAPDHANWDLVNSGDFTIEIWARYTATTLNSLFGQSTGAGGNPKWMHQGNGADVGAGNIGLHYQPGSLEIVFGAWAPSADTWYGLAFVRSGNNHYFFVDGTQVGSTISSASRPGLSTGTMRIGDDGEGTIDHNGHIAAVRITKGVARYTSNYTLPSLPLDTSGPVATRTGGKGDNAKRRRNIIKPTGLMPRRKVVTARQSVEERLAESVEIAREVAADLKAGIEPQRSAQAALPAIATMSEAEIDREIGQLLRRRIRTEDEEILLLTLMTAAAFA